MMYPTTDPVAALAQHLDEQQLLTPALCFLASHQPLALVAGQLLYLLAPLAALLDRPTWKAWAALLTDPNGFAYLQGVLASGEHVTPPPASQAHGRI
jgi:hypothetical protein